MYIERKSEIMEVNEATAALKGLLGIGSAGSDSVVAKPVEKEEEKGGENGVPEMVSPEQQSKSKKKRNNKKNKKKQDEAEKSSPSKPPKPQPNESSSAQKPKNNNSTKKKGAKGNNKNSKNAENFAWSAFQSSPDASKLPIPAFSSPVQSRKVISDTQLAASDLPVTVAENITQSQQPETPAANVSTDADSTTPTKEESATGVNLAVLASNPPPATPNDAVNHALGSPQGQLFSSPQPAYHASPHLQQHPFTTPPPPHPMHHQYHPYLPPPPPGHVTIQVQVPPVLMPGRQMVVTSPAGYPVQIAIPDGYQAGMIIPVFVPAAPPMQHMMPPSQPNHPGFAGGYYNSNLG